MAKYLLVINNAMGVREGGTIDSITDSVVQLFWVTGNSCLGNSLTFSMTNRVRVDRLTLCSLGVLLKLHYAPVLWQKNKQTKKL